MKKKVWMAALLPIFLATACVKDYPVNTIDSELRQSIITASESGSLTEFILPAYNDLANIPQDPLNPITNAKIELGKQIYHDTAFGIEAKLSDGIGSYSCASCHSSKAGFQACLPQGIGEGGLGYGLRGENRFPSDQYAADELDVQPVRTPTILNIAFQEAVLWNGQFGAKGVNEGTESQWTAGTPKEVNHMGFEGTEIQAIAGMDVHRIAVDEAFIQNSDYKLKFDIAFANKLEEERYTLTNAALAIAAFERSVVSNQAPFQKWLKGEFSAMSDQEKRGADLFFTKANCASCHNGPALNSMEFHALGMKDLDHRNDVVITDTDANENTRLGRGGFTGDPADNYKFKVPQLYNLSDSPFYGHGASFTDLKDLLEYKNRAVAENEFVDADQLAEGFVPLNLTDAEINDLNSFLQNALRDPDLQRYEPEAVVSGNCIPVNDQLSRIDLGCD